MKKHKGFLSIISVFVIALILWFFSTSRGKGVTDGKQEAAARKEKSPQIRLYHGFKSDCFWCRRWDLTGRVSETLRFTSKTFDNKHFKAGVWPIVSA